MVNETRTLDANAFTPYFLGDHMRQGTVVSKAKTADAIESKVAAVKIFMFKLLC